MERNLSGVCVGSNHNMGRRGPSDCPGAGTNIRREGPRRATLVPYDLNVTASREVYNDDAAHIHVPPNLINENTTHHGHQEKQAKSFFP